MYTHLDCCTHIQFAEDLDILHRPLFDVNIRLFKANFEYKKIVLACCSYIDWLMRMKKEGYTKPKGWSGANAGIPFNIIATHKLGVLINPKVWNKREPIIVNSNCGSLTLQNSIEVTRYKYIDLLYNDVTNGDRQQLLNYCGDDVFTIQHEVEHNLGILISDNKY